jgi:hypothetical protein
MVTEPNIEGASLPTGLEPLPELGPDVVGARVRSVVINIRWTIAVATALAAGFALAAGLPAFAGGWSAWGFVCLLVLGLAVVSAYHVRLARIGRKPVLVIDDTAVRINEPFNQVAVRLGAITRATALSRDVMIEARNGVERRGRRTRARWAAINHAKSFEVEPKVLAEYLLSRAEAARSIRVDGPS